MCQNAAHGVFKILYLHYFMNDCEFNGLPQSGLALNRIYHGDCLEGMKLLPARSVDMILSDPPYGITANAWDSIINMDRLWSEYKRIIKPKGAIVLTARCPFDKVLGMSNLPWLRYEWIWEKSRATGFLDAKRMPLRAHENVLVFCDRSPPYHPQFEKGKPYNPPYAPDLIRRLWRERPDRLGTLRILR